MTVLPRCSAGWCTLGLLRLVIREDEKIGRLLEVISYWRPRFWLENKARPLGLEGFYVLEVMDPWSPTQRSLDVVPKGTWNRGAEVGGLRRLDTTCVGGARVTLLSLQLLMCSVHFLEWGALLHFFDGSNLCFYLPSGTYQIPIKCKACVDFYCSVPLIVRLPQWMPVPMNHLIFFS